MWKVSSSVVFVLFPWKLHGIATSLEYGIWDALNGFPSQFVSQSVRLSICLSAFFLIALTVIAYPIIGWSGLLKITEKRPQDRAREESEPWSACLWYKSPRSLYNRAEWLQVSLGSGPFPLPWKYISLLPLLKLYVSTPVLLWGRSTWSPFRGVLQVLLSDGSGPRHKRNVTDLKSVFCCLLSVPVACDSLKSRVFLWHSSKLRAILSESTL